MLTGVLIPPLLGLALGKPAVDPSCSGRVAALGRSESRPHLEGELGARMSLVAVSFSPHQTSVPTFRIGSKSSIPA